MLVVLADTCLGWWYCSLQTLSNTVILHGIVDTMASLHTVYLFSLDIGHSARDRF